MRARDGYIKREQIFLPNQLISVTTTHLYGTVYLKETKK